MTLRKILGFITSRRAAQTLPAGFGTVFERQPEPEFRSFRSTWQCQRRIGRGRCRSRQTRVYWNHDREVAEAYCAKHPPEV